jgi:hypothetical protein
MEWWIVVSLALSVVAVGVVSRLRKPRRRSVRHDGNTIYPLW